MDYFRDWIVNITKIFVFENVLPVWGGIHAYMNS